MVSSWHAQEGREEREAGYDLSACGAGDADSIPWLGPGTESVCAQDVAQLKVSPPLGGASFPDCWCCAW